MACRIISISSGDLTIRRAPKSRRRRDRLPARARARGAARRRRRRWRARRRGSRPRRGRGRAALANGSSVSSQVTTFGRRPTCLRSRAASKAGQIDDGIRVLEEKQGRQAFAAVEVDARQVEEVGRRRREEAVGGQRREALADGLEASEIDFARGRHGADASRVESERRTAGGSSRAAFALVLGAGCRRGGRARFAGRARRARSRSTRCGRTTCRRTATRRSRRRTSTRCARTRSSSRTPTPTSR